jgi:hypothetical protein
VPVSRLAFYHLVTVPKLQIGLVGIDQVGRHC